MKKFLINHNWWFYFLLTYLVSWPIWAIGIVLLPEEFRIITVIIGAFGPFVSALILINITQNKSGLRDWLKQQFNFRIPFIWYLLTAILLPFGFAAIHHLIYIVAGGQSGIDFSLEWIFYFAYLIPTALLSGGNEEPGWRGYITPVLLHRFNIGITHVIVGVGWAIWHLPLYFGGNFGGDNQPILWLIIYCIPLSMIFTWIYYKSQKSIVPAMLFHAAGNVVFQYFPMETTVFDSIDDEFTVIKSIVYWGVALVLLVITRGTLGYKEQKTPE